MQANREQAADVLFAAATAAKLTGFLVTPIADSPSSTTPPETRRVDDCLPAGVTIARLAPGDEHVVLAAGELFDAPPSRQWTARFLSSQGHHLLVARDQDGAVVGFVSGVQTTHPDKGTEMFLYELSVAVLYRKRGIGRALVDALANLARDLDCHGMWVGSEPDNAAAIATIAPQAPHVPRRS